MEAHATPTTTRLAILSFFLAVQMNVAPAYWVIMILLRMDRQLISWGLQRFRKWHKATELRWLNLHKTNISSRINKKGSFQFLTYVKELI